LLLSVAVMAAAAGTAWAHGRGHHGGQVRFGLYLGAPLVWHYAPPVYYYPRTVVVPAAPPTYIERGASPEESAPPQSYWYYCRGADGYYPYVKHCPGGWERVLPHPPG
jgi:hypothetical protein